MKSNKILLTFFLYYLFFPVTQEETMHTRMLQEQKMD